MNGTPAPSKPSDLGMTQNVNRLAVVSGAGSGLGRALAIGLAKRGLVVAGLGRGEEALEQTATHIVPGRFLSVVVDVSDANAVATAFERLDSEAPPLSILINNAAIYERFDFLASPSDRFMKSVAVNLGGVINTCHAALQRMTRTGTGRILNVTTFADLAPLSGSSAYSVSKGAARIFTRALVADISDRFPRIVVNDWVPGALATEMGVPDGLAPETAAQWGVELALMDDPTLTGTLFDQDLEQLPRRGIKGRIKDAVLLRPRPRPRRLGAG